MKITFIKRHAVQQHDGKGPVYEAGQTYAFDGFVAESYASKYIQRGYAEVAHEAPAADVLLPPVEAAGTPDTAGEANLTAEALLEAIQGDPPMEFFAFKAAASKILGDATPAKKVDIIEALKALVAA